MNDLYKILEERNISGTRVKKMALIIQIKQGLSRKEIKQFSKEIIENKKDDNEVLFLYLSDKSEEIIRERDDSELWNCIVSWKKQSSEFRIEKIINGHMEKDETYCYEWNLNIYKELN